MVDPVQRAQRVRPQAVDQPAVAGPVVRGGEQDQPQRRGVDRAVVRAERQLAGACHLAGPQLVQDLAGLGVALRVLVGGLERGEDLERLDRDLRPHAQRLERGDQRVAAEQRREPRHAGGQVSLGLARAVVDQQPQVAGRSVDGEVDQLVVGPDLGHAAVPGVVRRGDLVDGEHGLGREQRVVGVGRVAGLDALGRRPLLDRPGQPAQLARVARGERPVPGEPDPAGIDGPRHVRFDRLDRVRALAERDVRGRPPPVEAGVAERDPVAPSGDRQLEAALDPGPAADLEDVGGVGGELERHLDLLIHLRVVHDPDALLEHPARDHPLAADAQLLRGERVLGPHLVGDVALEPGVGELDRAVVVAAGRRLEEHRALAVHAQDRGRQAAGVAVVQAQPAAVGVHVAERVREQVQVALLEDLDRAEVGGLDDRPDHRVEEPRRLGPGGPRPGSGLGRRRLAGGRVHRLSHGPSRRRTGRSTR